MVEQLDDVVLGFRRLGSPVVVIQRHPCSHRHLSLNLSFAGLQAQD